MELLIRVQDDKAQYVAEQVKKMAFVEEVEVKYPPSKAESDKDFLKKLRKSVSDAENPEAAYNSVLQGLREVEAYERGEIKLQSWEEMLKELEEYRDEAHNK
jgi:hypothetical protein